MMGGMPSEAPASHIFESMGTVVSIRAVGGIEPAPASAIESVFARWNDLFSLYSPASDLSRIASGQLALVNASRDVRDAYASALDWRARTAGAFTPHRPDGVIDLNGIVKALAMAEAGEILDAATHGGHGGHGGPGGHGNPGGAGGPGGPDSGDATPSAWLLNCGGDVLMRGEWTVGVADPSDRGALLASVRLTPPAARARDVGLGRARRPHLGPSRRIRPGDSRRERYRHRRRARDRDRRGRARDARPGDRLLAHRRTRDSTRGARGNAGNPGDPGELTGKKVARIRLALVDREC